MKIILFSNINRVVYNQKRHGTFPVGNRMVTFERRYNVLVEKDYWIMHTVFGSNSLA